MTDTISNITLADLEKLKGYVEERTKSPYELKRLRNKDHLLILYTTGKLVVQGTNSPFEPDIKKQVSSSLDLVSSIGSDETLKGDTFGGLVICAAYFKQGEVDVTDSKAYSDNQIQALAMQLLENYPDRFSSRELTPEQYNQFYAELGSQTAILNVLHQEVGKELKEKFKAPQVVDQYPGCDAGDYCEQKAERAHTSVAAASILARYLALKQFERLSEKAEFILPKGSTHVKEAIQELKKRKLPLDEFCKMHFSTVIKG
ncbi:MAG: hypothetical protein KC535_00725 [Nanoarchaeota archaeon]|nr:hypothetical protein [Nanoarchaeota archaeon]